MALSTDQAGTVGAKLNVNWAVVPLDTWEYALGVELERGKRDATYDDLLATGKIALAHLLEYPDYYQRLAHMESEAKQYWSGRPKPSVVALPSSTRELQLIKQFWQWQSRQLGLPVAHDQREQKQHRVTAGWLANMLQRNPEAPVTINGNQLLVGDEAVILPAGTIAPATCEIPEMARPWLEWQQKILSQFISAHGIDPTTFPNRLAFINRYHNDLGRWAVGITWLDVPPSQVLYWAMMKWMSSYG